MAESAASKHFNRSLQTRGGPHSLSNILAKAGRELRSTLLAQQNTETDDASLEDTAQDDDSSPDGKMSVA